MFWFLGFVGGDFNYVWLVFIYRKVYIFWVWLDGLGRLGAFSRIISWKVERFLSGGVESVF